MLNISYWRVWEVPDKGSVHVEGPPHVREEGGGGSCCRVLKLPQQRAWFGQL